MPPEGALAERLVLVDTIDHLLNKGVVLVGDATLSLAGVDLVYVGVNLLISSVETLQKGTSPSSSPNRAGQPVRPQAHPVRQPQESPTAITAQPVIDATPTGKPRREAPGASGPTGVRQATTQQAQQLLSGLEQRISEESEDRPESGLAKLVLTLVELLRQLLERQAVRRMEGGSLSDPEIERMGIALSELEAKMAELREVFSLTEEDLNLDLGPLGSLLQ